MPAEKITHEKIIHAVLDCAFIKSVGGTSLADIAGKLGIKKASLYNHYESREAMLDDTVHFCGEYLKKTALIPSEMTATAQKYTAEAVLKGIVHRWVKINEKEPLLQIYSFIESEKYFSPEAAAISKESRARILNQTIIALNSLIEAKKISPATKKTVSIHAEIFTNMLFSLLDKYIVEKKNYIRSNPQSGDGELFSALPFEPDFTRIDPLLEEFCKIL